MKKFRDLLEDYNKQNPDKKEPITEGILSLLNDLEGIRMSTIWNRDIFPDMQSYQSQYDKLREVLNNKAKETKNEEEKERNRLKTTTLIFGGDFIKIESELLNDQIQEILTRHLNDEYSVRNLKKLTRGRGQKQSLWLQTIIQGKPIIEKLYSEGIKDDFLSHYFNVEVETFKRKIRTVFKKAV